MGRKTIISIVVLTSIVMVGLVSIQLYWIQNAIEVREENFSRSVDEALSNVVYKLEKLEAIYEIERAMTVLESQGGLISKMDSASDNYLRELGLLSSSAIADSIFAMDNGQFKVQYLEDVDKAFVLNYDTTFLSYVTQKVKDINSRIVSGKREQSKSDSAQVKVKKQQKARIRRLIKEKSSLLNEVLEDMFNPRRKQSFESRKKFHLVDSLIGSELKNKNINTDYEFGIYSLRRNLMVIEKTGHYHKELRLGYAKNLSPKEILRSPEYLFLYFPHERRFLLTQMRSILAVSVILIVSLLLLFTWTIFSLFRQKKLSEMKNDFINNMTHEFKTPISTVSLACEALNDKDITLSDEIHENYVKIIREENQRLGGMAEKILQTAILEKGQVKLKYVILDIHQVLKEVIKNIRIQVEIKDGSIETHLNAPSPIIQGDKVHVTNLFFNLLDNANKYTPRKPQLIVTTENTEDGIIVSISDNGIGISKSNQKKVFDKLFRVSTGNIHDIKGFGLGLSYVKFIVEKHNGKVTLESELGKGSTFRVYLPFHKRYRPVRKNYLFFKTLRRLSLWKN